MPRHAIRRSRKDRLDWRPCVSSAAILLSFVQKRLLPCRNRIKALGMNRNGLYLVIALLAVAVVGLGLYVYQEETKPGVEIKIGRDGVSVQEN